jgi:hypothetical protein
MHRVQALQFHLLNLRCAFSGDCPELIHGGHDDVVRPRGLHAQRFADLRISGAAYAKLDSLALLLRRLHRPRMGLLHINPEIRHSHRLLMNSLKIRQRFVRHCRDSTPCPSGFHQRNPFSVQGEIRAESTVQARISACMHVKGSVTSNAE